MHGLKKNGQDLTGRGMSSCGKTDLPLDMPESGINCSANLCQFVDYGTWMATDEPNLLRRVRLLRNLLHLTPVHLCFLH